jgi:hypothetical protein
MKDQKEIKQDACRRSSVKSKGRRTTNTTLEQANDTSSSILPDLKACLDKRDEELKAYPSQELAIIKDVMEENLHSVIDPKQSTQKTGRKTTDNEYPPASEEDDSRPINRLLGTATLDKPDDEDPPTSSDEENSSRPKRASGRGRPEEAEKKRRRKKKKKNTPDRDSFIMQRSSRSSKEDTMKALVSG